MPFVTGQVNITSSAAQLINDNGPRQSTGGPSTVVVVNTGNTTVFLGSSTVTTSNGFPLPAGAGLAEEYLSPSDLYAVAASTGTLAYIFERNA